MPRRSKAERHRLKREEKRKNALHDEAALVSSDQTFNAHRAFMRNDLDLAATLADRAIRSDPSNLEARVILLSIASARNEAAVLERHGREILRIHGPSAWQGEVALSEALQLQRRWREAVEHLKRALAVMRSARGRDLQGSPGYLLLRSQLAELTQRARRERAATPNEARSPRAAPPPRVRLDVPLPSPARSRQRDEIEKPVPPAPLAFRFEASAVSDLLAGERYDSLAAHRLNLEAHAVLFVAEYEDLLCLNAMRGVEHFAYQIETARRVLRQFRGRALLCDEVGLGKTIEAGMILKEYALRGLIKRVLILTPPSLVSQWKEELAAKFDFPCATTSDEEYRRDPAGFWARGERVIASIATAKSEKNFNLVASREYDMVVIDEAHHLKNRSTLNWKLGDALRSRFLLLLTATPVQNNLMELHNLITVLRPGQLKTAAVFKQRFQKRGQPLSPANRDELRGLLAEVMIRNRRSDVNISLPPRHASTVLLSLAHDEEELYHRVTDFVRSRYPIEPASRRLLLMALQMEAGSSPFALAATLEKLAAGSSFENASAELLALAEAARAVRASAKGAHLLRVLVENPGQKIVFTRYVATLRYIARLFAEAGISHADFTGQMTAAEKDENVERFRRGEAQVLLSTESGGEGRNLQFCNTIFNYDLPWNPMRIEQRIGRVHRIGQTRDVFVFNFSAKGTLEDYLLAVLDEKINMFELVVGEVEMILGNLTDERDFPDIVMELWAGSKSNEEAAGKFQALGEGLLAAKSRYDETKKLDEALFGGDYGT